MKNAACIVLAFLIVFSFCGWSSAGGTVEDKINALTLEPLLSELSADFRANLDAVMTDDMTNYQRLRAAYDWTASYIEYQYGYDCTISSLILKDVMEYVGLRTYQISGATKTASGGWTWHVWNGVELDGTWYFFDADLPKYGVPVEKCFGVASYEATIYKDAVLFNVFSEDIRARHYWEP